MKTTTLLVLSAIFFTSFAQAGVDSINPSKTVTDLFKVYGKSKVIDENTIEVRGPRYTGSEEEIEDEGHYFNIQKAVYNRAKTLSQGVFVATSGEGSDHHGTAFSIGNNLVLTNQHVLSPSRENTSRCGQFDVVTNETKSERFKCLEVHFCDKSKDYCLIEMKPNTHKERINGEKVVVETNLSRIPSLKLDNSYKLGDSGKYSNKVFTVIGNTRGFGIHYSAGKEAALNGKDILFYAPLTQGNSGGPLINEEGNIIGIAKYQSKEFYGSSTNVFNGAISITEVVETLKIKLQNKPKVLEKLNKAILAPKK